MQLYSPILYSSEGKQATDTYNNMVNLLKLHKRVYTL